MVKVKNQKNKKMQQRILPSFITRIPNSNACGKCTNEVVSGFGSIHVLRFPIDPSKCLGTNGEGTNLR